MIEREREPITHPLGITAASKRQEITSVVEGVEKREPPVHCWWECKLVQPLWKAV